MAFTPQKREQEIYTHATGITNSFKQVRETSASTEFNVKCWAKV